MREIKFRAWDKSRKKMIYGPTDSNPNASWVLAVAPLLDNSAMQYTGLKDKNGKEIYEGDIISFLRGTISFDSCVVGWSYDQAAFEILSDGLSVSFYGLKSITVRGNIYENPELLEKK